MNAKMMAAAGIVAAALMGNAYGAAFTAYNDLGGADSASAPGASVTNIHYKSADGSNQIGAFTASGSLVDYATGSNTGVTLSIGTNSSYGQDSYGQTANGSAGAAGSPLYNAFNGKIDMHGLQNFPSAVPTYPGGDVYYTFSGLDPAATYQMTLATNRSNSAFTDRYAKVTISGADSFGNTSTNTLGGTTMSTGSMANDTTEIMCGNTGDIVQYSSISAGSDGQFTISVTGSRNTTNGYRWYTNGLILSGSAVPEPTSLGLLGVAGLLLGKRRSR